MANHNPRIENLTRAGAGQPRKGRKRLQITLPPDLVDRIDGIAAQQFWDRSYAIEQLCRAILNLDPDYDESDFVLIRKGRGVE